MDPWLGLYPGLPFPGGIRPGMRVALAALTSGFEDNVWISGLTCIAPLTHWRRTP